MDIRAILAELRKERDAIDAAIRNLERLDRAGSAVSRYPYKLTESHPANGANGRYRGSAPSEGSEVG